MHGGSVHLAGLELQPAYAALARRNAAENSIPMQIETGDAAHCSLSPDEVV